MRGPRTLLRARLPPDAEILHALWSDAETWLLTATVPYAPESVDSMRLRLEREAASPSADTVWLTAEVHVDEDRPAAIGVAGLWGMDQFNRRAHVSIALLPYWRGKGYGTELLTTLCRYAFVLRGMRRLEAETLERNTAMQSLAQRCGFACEGRLRQRDYDGGRWSDVLLYGLLVTDFAEAP